MHLNHLSIFSKTYASISPLEFNLYVYGSGKIFWKSYQNDFVVYSQIESLLYVCVCVCIHTYIHILSNTYLCVHVYVYMNINIHKDIHMHKLLSAILRNKHFKRCLFVHIKCRHPLHSALIWVHNLVVPLTQFFSSLKYGKKFFLIEV